MIYLDNAATTMPDPAVIEAISLFCKNNYANPSGSYSFSAIARNEIAKAKRSAASLIGAAPEEIFFTSGGSESDNWAINGIVDMFPGRRPHIVTSKIEHHAVLNTLKRLEEKGRVSVTYIAPDSQGFISPSDIEKAINSDTVLVSVMSANNEIGTIEDVAAIGNICRAYDVVFHTDAVQAFGHIGIDVKAMNISLLSASAHKLHGVKGTGLLYVSKDVQLKGFRSFILGGAQESGFRAGTENVPGIVGFGKACEIVTSDLCFDAIKAKRDYFYTKLLANVPGVSIIGAVEKRLPGNLNVCFEGVVASSLLIELDMKGICCSTGSSCDAGSGTLSHVLLSLGLDESKAASCIRFTLSKFTTLEELDKTVCVIRDSVERLRALTNF